MTTLPSLPDHQFRLKMNRLPSVSSLMSPPETKPLDNFPSVYSHYSASQEVKLPPISDDRKRTQSELVDLPSPPVTPYAGNKKRKTNHEQPDTDNNAGLSRDPVLYPRSESFTDAANDEPLFGPVPSVTVLLDQHIATHMARFENKVNKPTREEYHLALSCVPIVSTQYNRNPFAWARKERETLERQMAMMDHGRVEFHSANLKRLAPAPSKRTVTGQARVARTPRPKRTPKSTPTQRVLDDFNSGLSSSLKPSKPLGTNRDDIDYKSLKDYSPPMHTLGGNTKGLKADWKGQMLDLSNDPDRHCLDPAEINLAATLRLSCATYLCSKRRIFEARVKALNIGKEFRKTDAQQACKIDVNKASKLWTAYDRVGWFKPDHFTQFLK
ncbi:putative SWIRM domain protein Fun19 [Talaromyces proteolyticus]|uniref:SWIRM domain protein Fun19 n=1 Tax=Talaromyces proteolyticus TaxID=1131652 RepID=A0AAD4KFU6_9EURO|nr:putative SWIRM domain protein Fun19 [Talaromyces proteolyticus]KAH8691094.1 putative SWIRM domain protein Fun19 [Talaromyces proteolyticus]